MSLEDRFYCIEGVFSSESLEDRFYCIEDVLSSECPLKTVYRRSHMWGMCVRCSQVLLFVEGHICGVCVCVVVRFYCL